MEFCGLARGARRGGIGVASATTGELQVDCTLGFVVEISGEVSRTREVVEYITTMGGDAIRNLE